MKKIFAALLFAALGGLAKADTPAASAPLFAATLNDLDDKPVALERYRGKPLVVNFWARWCAPCRQEMPELIRFRAAQKGKIEVLGLGLEDKPEAVREFVKANNIDYPIFLTKEKGIPLMQALGNNIGGLPFTLFIDRNGQVIEKKVGMIKKADLDAATPLLLKN
ncbi:MAG: thioredoxin [Proteobacteria bacterium]|nr:thioredoxin [Pseudomonadota bacterium]